MQVCGMTRFAQEVKWKMWRKDSEKRLWNLHSSEQLQKNLDLNSQFEQIVKISVSWPVQVALVYFLCFDNEVVWLYTSMIRYKLKHSTLIDKYKWSMILEFSVQTQSFLSQSHYYLPKSLSFVERYIEFYDWHKQTYLNPISILSTINYIILK
jgi:hypothetical protein